MRKKILTAVVLAPVILAVFLVVFEVLFFIALAANRFIRAPFCQPAGETRVYVLGESTSAGEPYMPKISFPKILSYMYNGRLRGKELRIINLAEPGSILERQYWKLFRELTLRPPRDGLLLIYAGINESQGGGGDRAVFSFWKFTQKLVILSKLSSLFPDSRILAACFGRFYSPAKYEYRLARIIRLAQKNRLKTVVSTLTGNFSDFPPYRNPVFRDDADRVIYARARRHEASGRFEKAAAIYSALLPKAAHDRSELYYRRGKCMERLGKFKEARENFHKAVDRGIGQRPTYTQNGAIKRVAADNGAVLADTARYFEKEAANGLVGYNLFVDAHHPNIRGYILIAKSFSKGISELYGEKPLRPAPSPDEVRSYLDFSDADEFRAYISRIRWFCGEASLSESGEMLKTADSYILKADALWRKMGRDPDQKIQLDFGRLLVSAGKRDHRGVMRWLKEGDFLDNNIQFIKFGNSTFEKWFYAQLVESGLPESDQKKLAIEH